MLVLTRKIGEKFMLSIPGYDDVVITVVDIRNCEGAARARIGIDAHQDIRIAREELIGREPRTYDPDANRGRIPGD